MRDEGGVVEGLTKGGGEEVGAGAFVGMVPEDGDSIDDYTDVREVARGGSEMLCRRF